MAKWLNLPIVLVVSARGKARSAAAIVKGFEEFDPDLKIAGVIFSRTGSRRHYEYLKKAVEQNCRTKCLGFMPKNDQVAMPERHLGLVTADEIDISGKTLSILSAMVRDHIDMAGLINSLDPFEPLGKRESKKAEIFHENRPTIAVARDKAFCFYYQDNLDILKQFGAKIIEFSPLNDTKLPNGIDGIYLGGGYPEVFARELSRKSELLQEIREKSLSNMPIYGECGGFMFLCQSLFDVDETRTFSMSGCFDFNVQISKRLMSLGYREITLKKDTIIGKKGDMLRGHEFHYSSLQNPDIDTPNVYHVTSRAGQDISLKGYQIKNTLGSYLHIHFGSNEGCAKRFVDTCKIFKDKKNKNEFQNT